MVALFDTTPWYVIFLYSLRIVSRMSYASVGIAVHFSTSPPVPPHTVFSTGAQTSNRHDTKIKVMGEDAITTYYTITTSLYVWQLSA